MHNKLAIETECEKLTQRILRSTNSQKKPSKSFKEAVKSEYFTLISGTIHLEKSQLEDDFTRESELNRLASESLLKNTKDLTFEGLPLSRPPKSPAHSLFNPDFSSLKDPYPKRPPKLQRKSPQTESKPLKTQSEPLRTQSKPLKTQSESLRTQSNPLKTQSKPLQTQRKPATSNQKLSFSQATRKYSHENPSKFSKFPKTHKKTVDYPPASHKKSQKKRPGKRARLHRFQKSSSLFK